MQIVLKNFRIVDEEIDIIGSLVIRDGLITEIQEASTPPSCEDRPALIIDGSRLTSSGALPVLMPAFVDLHAHFRDPCLYSEAAVPSEMVESASLAAAAGGFGTAVCMANTKPAVDTVEKAALIKTRCDALGLIDLYPVLSLTKKMEGKELSEISSLVPLAQNGAGANGAYFPLMLSEDGKDLADDALFLAAMKEAKRLRIPVSCHCDLGGEENAVRRAIELGKKAGCRIHIAHVSTRGSLDAIRQAKKEISANAEADAAANAAGSAAALGATCFSLTCEAMPHHLCLTEEDAAKLGEKTWGKVAPPLRSEDDRKDLIQALMDGTVDVIATDHAPHSQADKEAGAPGFSGFETAFAAVYSELVRGGKIDLKHLSSLMSASPARLLGFSGAQKRGRLLPDFRADLVIADTEAPWIVDPGAFKSRGKNSPFKGRRLYGKILMTIRSGRIVFERGGKSDF